MLESVVRWCAAQTYWRFAVILLGSVVLLPPNIAAGQTATASIAGTVRDGSGAVLPGVTVEATSPALIEGSRTVTTDGQGNYQIEALRPGIYTVTFQLAGFGTFRREAIELTTGVTSTANAVLAVGAVQESITVTGATSIVDVRGTQQQTVFTQELKSALPLGRQVAQYAAILPNIVQTSPNQDVGGTQAKSTYLGAHGVSGGGGSQGLFYDGVSFMSPSSSHGFILNDSAIQESNLRAGGYTAETKYGTVQLNLVPRDGSNTLRLTSQGSYMISQASNLDDELKARGATQGGKNRYFRTTSVGVGGPILHDKLWFHAAYLRAANSVTTQGYYSTDPASWVYSPDIARGTYASKISELNGEVRLTWQIDEKNKINGHYAYASNCQCGQGNAGRSAEADTIIDQVSPVAFVTWTMPATNRLLFQAAVGTSRHSSLKRPIISNGALPDAISVLEQSSNIRYRSNAWEFSLTNAWGNDPLPQVNGYFSTSYVTGSHALKTGVQVLDQTNRDITKVAGDVTYRVFNGVANQITMLASPADTESRAREFGFFIQDQWTIKRLTLNLGGRFDTFRGWVPEQTQPAGRWVPERHYDEVTDVPNWKDVTPRVGASYDLFGDGHTAIKATWGKFMDFVNAGQDVFLYNPLTTVASSATRTWADANGDWIPQESELGPISNVNFGKSVVSTFYDEDLIHGWGKQLYNWQTSVQLEHQLSSRLGVNVGYFRTWWGSFTATDNRAVTPQDYNQYCLTAPADVRLPGGGGQQICGLYDLSRAKVGQVNNLVGPADKFGKQSQIFNGVDALMNWRFMGSGSLVGGLSVGRSIEDTCNTIVDSPDKRFCRDVPAWSAGTSVRFGFVVPLPLDFRVSGTFQNNPGIPIQAIYSASNAEIAPSLGRNLSACPTDTGACTARVNVNLIGSNAMYEGRVTQVDLRMSKAVRVGKGRVSGNVELYNLFNDNTVRGLTTTYGSTWLRPTTILGARMLKLAFQVDL